MRLLEEEISSARVKVTSLVSNNQVLDSELRELRVASPANSKRIEQLELANK